MCIIVVDAHSEGGEFGESLGFEEVPEVLGDFFLLGGLEVGEEFAGV